MSSVGFDPSTQKELEQLRETWKTLNDLLRNIHNAEVCLSNLDLKLTASHLKVAKWNVVQAKKTLREVGQAKARKAVGK